MGDGLTGEAVGATSQPANDRQVIEHIQIIHTDDDGQVQCLLYAELSPNQQWLQLKPHHLHDHSLKKFRSGEWADHWCHFT